jgi:amidophosphoribosyltransferase
LILPTVLVRCSLHISSKLLIGALELVAHGRTRQEIAQYINADEIIFQGLDDLKAACIEAAEGECKVKDFEVGLFNGRYITEVPEGYFEHLSQLRGKKRKAVVGVTDMGAGRAMLVANSGPMGMAPRQQKESGDDGAGMNGAKGPEYREDIR